MELTNPMYVPALRAVDCLTDQAQHHPQSRAVSAPASAARAAQQDLRVCHRRSHSSRGVRGQSCLYSILRRRGKHSIHRRQGRHSSTRTSSEPAACLVYDMSSAQLRNKTSTSCAQRVHSGRSLVVDFCRSTGFGKAIAQSTGRTPMRVFQGQGSARLMFQATACSMLRSSKDRTLVRNGQLASYQKRFGEGEDGS